SAGAVEKSKATRRGLRKFALCAAAGLPPGDAANMPGRGGPQTQLLLVTSSSSRKIAPHFNVGYTFADRHSADQINYVSGLEVAASRRLTVAGDLIGRMLVDTLRRRAGLVT